MGAWYCYAICSTVSLCSARGENADCTVQNINTNPPVELWIDSSFAPQLQLPTHTLSIFPFLKLPNLLFFSFSGFPFAALLAPQQPLQVFYACFTRTDKKDFYANSRLLFPRSNLSKQKTHPPLSSSNMPRSRNDSASSVSSVGSQVSFQLPTELSVRDPIVRRATPFPL